MDILTGSVLGRYRIEEEVGRGGMGAVYRAEHLDTHEPIAVKVLPPELARQGDFLARFRREIDTLRQLRHEHIAAIDDFGEQDGITFYGMEFVDGRSLDEILRRDSKLGWEQTLDVVEQLAQALKHAHDRSIVHRDIKPANILVDILWEVKLTDFGIARAVDATRLTVTGGVIGTAEYMSPEQAEGRQLDKRSDLYSLGVVMYRMLSGRLPFKGRTTIDLMKEHRFGVYEPLANLVPETPKRVIEIVDRLLLKDPAERTPDGSVLVDEIARARSRRRLPGDETVVPTGPTRVMPGAVVEPPDRPARREGMTAMLREVFSRDTLATGSGALGYALRRWGIVLLFMVAAIVAMVYLSRSPGPEELYASAKQWIELADQRGLSVSERSLFRRKAGNLFDEIEREHPDFAWPAEAKTLRRVAKRAQREYVEDFDRAAGLAVNTVEQRMGEPIRPRKPRSPSRQSYEECVLLIENGHRSAARGKLEAMIDLYEDDPESGPWVTLARKRLGELEESAPSAARAPYEAAMKLAQAGQGETALKKLHALVRLFGEAAEERLWVERARQAIGRLEKGAASQPAGGAASQPSGR